MEILNVIEKALIALTGKEDIKPCDYFDMIAGTSTGGYVANQIVISSGVNLTQKRQYFLRLIAIMLGRLKMSIKECIAAYDDLASTIFDSINGEGEGYYSHTEFEKAVKGIIADSLQDENAQMMSPPGDKCKVYEFCCTFF